MNKHKPTLLMPQSPIVSKTNVAGVVVLYHSPVSCIEKIKTYIHQVDKLYIVDNTPTGVTWISDVEKEYSSIQYALLGANKGIAYALNVGAKLAIADGYAYLLTMDDDSGTPSDLIAQMGLYWNQHLLERIGIVCPQHALTTASQPDKQQRMEPKNVLTVMSSGNLVNLEAYQKIGGFDNRLFIDVVDHDYDLNLSVNNYRIVELPTVKLVHRLGQQRQVLFGLIRFVTHNPLRNYYLIRNSLIVGWRYRKQHPAYFIEALRTVLVEIIKIIFLEDQKRSRLTYAWRALNEGLVNPKNLYK